LAPSLSHSVQRSSVRMATSFRGIAICRSKYVMLCALRFQKDDAKSGVVGGCLQFV
jgi:hypothetical protein